MPTYGDTSAGVVNLFFGNVSEVRPSRSTVVLTVSSQLELLSASRGTLAGVSQATLLTYGTPSLVGNEFIAWRDATLTAASAYTLDTLLPTRVELVRRMRRVI